MVAKAQVPARGPNGGARPGAGRPKAIGNKSRLYPTLRGEPIALRQKYQTTPLDHLLYIINTPFEARHKLKPRGDNETPAQYKLRKQSYQKRKNEYEQRQDNAAKSAAPFMHYRLAAIELTGKESEPQRRNVDLSRLNTQELDTLEKLMRKADRDATVTLGEDQYRTVNGDENDRH